MGRSPMAQRSAQPFRKVISCSSSGGGAADECHAPSSVDAQCEDPGVDVGPPAPSAAAAWHVPVA
eukprot:8803525-Lingulodinium_polyedra.AAC.1